MQANRCLPLFLSICALIACGAHAQSNLGFLAKSPAGNFTADDWTLLKSAMRTVLNSTDDTLTQYWNNPTTKANGEVHTLKAYQDLSGSPCKQLQIDSQARGYKGSYKQALCRQKDGSWLSDDGAIALPPQ